MYVSMLTFSFINTLQFKEIFLTNNLKYDFSVKKYVVLFDLYISTNTFLYVGFYVLVHINIGWRRN